MNVDQIIAERLLLLIETHPPNTFKHDDKLLSILLDIKIQKIKDIMQELLLTSFIKRSRNGGNRVLVSLRTEKEKVSRYRLISMKAQALENSSSSKRSKENEERKEKERSKEKEKKEEKKLKKNSLTKVKEEVALWPDSQELSFREEMEESKEPKILKFIKEHIVFWNSLQLKKCWTNKDTKILRLTVNYFNRLKKGTLYTNTPLSKIIIKPTDEDIQKSILNFSKAVMDPLYDPINGSSYHAYLKRISLSAFLCNPITESTIGTSLFYHYLNNPPKQLPIQGVVDDQFPTLTQVFKRYYIKNVLGGILPTDGFSLKQEDDLRMAGIQTSEFYDKNKNKLSTFGMMGGVTKKVLAGWVCEAIEIDSVNFKNNITSGWFSSPYTFNTRLPTFLYNQGIIEGQ